MWDTLEASHPNRRKLLIFHSRRMREIETDHPSYLPWIKQLQEERSLFLCPAGSNDDWYWLYACVKAQVGRGSGELKEGKGLWGWD